MYFLIIKEKKKGGHNATVPQVQKTELLRRFFPPSYLRQLQLLLVCQIQRRETLLFMMPQVQGWELYQSSNL
jgi:hypothetical protein